MQEHQHIVEDAPAAEPGPQADRRQFLFHLGAYLLVNGVLALINLSGEVPEGETRTLWFVWPLAGWGIGVAGHALALLLKRIAATSPAQPNLFQDRDVRTVAIHLFVYLAVNTLLISVNLTQTPGSFWFIWPLAGWGIGLAAHAFIVYREVLKRTTERYATEQRILQEIQVERLAAAIAAAIEPEEQAEEAAKPAKKPARRKRAAAKTKKPAARKKSAAAKTKTTKTAAKAKSPARSRAKSTARTSSKAASKSTARTSAKSSSARTRKTPAKKPAAQKVS